MEEPGVAAPGWEFCGVVRGLSALLTDSADWAAVGPKQPPEGRLWVLNQLFLRAPFRSEVATS